MAYYKQGCKWGKNAPDFYDILVKHSIVICNDSQMEINDIVAIAKGFKVVALARITENRIPVTQRPELKDDFDKFEIDYIDSNHIAKAKIWELDKPFRYKVQKGICKIQKNDTVKTIDKLITEIKNMEMIKIYKKLLLNNHNLILTGAPGTGKTFLAKEIAKSLDAVCELVQFHPSYDYTDFVEGLRPVKKGDQLGFERTDGVFKSICKKALSLKDTPHVLIIDEINRGEVSKIFGELFYSIDPSYRGENGKVLTQYQNLVTESDAFYEGFYVPENVYIIGTMNDIDRSVESMDFAMRRRFAWKEITAKSRQNMLDLDEVWNPNPKPSQQIIDEIKIRMDNLNSCIIDEYESEGLSEKEKTGLTKAYQIGASYFLKYALYNDFDELWNNHIEGLLSEYLRGVPYMSSKLERLKKSYNDTSSH